MILVPDEGERYLLKLLLKDAVPADLTFILGLFRNDLEPTHETILSAVTEANFAGYLPVEMNRADWTIPATVGVAAQATYRTVFTTWVASSGEQRCYGWYVRDADSNVLLWIERFASPIDVSPVIPAALLPVMRLRSEFEA